MTMVSFTRLDGTTIRVASWAVVAVRTDLGSLPSPLRAYIEMLGTDTPELVTSDMATVVSAIDELGAVLLIDPNSGQPTTVFARYVTSIRVDPSAPTTRCYVSVAGKQTPYYADAPASVVAALVDAAMVSAGPVMSTVFTPVGTIVTNLDSLTMTQAYGLRIGNVCAVWGGAAIDATVAGVTEFRASIPWASTFAVSNELTGQSSVVSEFPGLVRADVPTGSAQVRTTVVSTAALSLRYSYGYVKLP